jgi:hypothetical protein
MMPYGFHIHIMGRGMIIGAPVVVGEWSALQHLGVDLGHRACQGDQRLALATAEELTHTGILPSRHHTLALTSP